MKFMNMKRFGATVMAGALALSMATPAFAATNTTEISGTYQAVELAVTVPTTGTAQINPYGLPVALDEETIISGQQILTAAPLVIMNKSKVALAVKANAKVELDTGATDVTLATAAVDDTATDKKLFVKFEAFEAPGVLEDTEALELNAAFAALDSADAKLTKELSATAGDATGTLVLREGDEEGLVQDGGAAFFRLTGSATKAPTKAWDEAKDKFKATIVFTFEPGEYIMPYTTAPTATGTLNDVGATAALTLALPRGVKLDKTVTPAWKTDKTTNLTLEDAGSTDADGLKGTATVKKLPTSSSPVKANVWVEFKGTDGLTYKSASVEVSITKP